MQVVSGGEVVARTSTTTATWELMCLDHFASEGVGLGMGLGQVYVHAPFLDWPGEEREEARLGPSHWCIGYASLVRQLHLAVMPHHRWSFIVGKGVAKEISGRHSRLHVYRNSSLPDIARSVNLDEFRWSSIILHLTFAFKHEGVNLEILDALFDRVDVAAFEGALSEAIGATPTGTHLRRLWCLYELLTGRRLEVEDLSVGNYVNLLDPDMYFTGRERRSQRHRVLVNLLGGVGFSPSARRARPGPERSGPELAEKVQKATADLPPEMIRRANHFLYTKETRSSFAIEKAIPSSTREERFVWLLEQAHRQERLSADSLLELQNAVVDSRFADKGWRTEQVYVGDVLDHRAHRIHFIAPRPQELPSIMEGFLNMLETTSKQTAPPLVWAAAASFGFDFIHPFRDGNGRIHRWLIHWVLSQRGVAPADGIIPISAVMLHRSAEYDSILEKFSRPLLRLLEYTVDVDGVVAVQDDLSRAYRYFDVTPMAEALSAWFDEAVDKELASELHWLARFDDAKKAVREVVDLPDRLLTTFVRCCLDNQGRLSKRKRKDLFYMLTDDELPQMEEAVATAFALPAPPPSGDVER